jgi:hypothetical protein
MVSAQRNPRREGGPEMTRSSRIILVAVLVAPALAAAVAVPALTASTTSTTAMPATAVGKTIYACLTARHTLSRVSVTKPPTCPTGTVPVQWEGLAGQPVPSPTSTSPAPSPSPTATSPSPTATSPAPSQSPTGAACVTSAPSGNCGPYDYQPITNSNGYNTYVGNNCWADPQCKQTIYANNPGDWRVVATQPAGNTAVKTYPDVQQLFNNWCSGGGWGNCFNDTPISGLAQLTSTYAETTPRGGTIAQFAWDIWTSNNSGYPNEIMVWVDNSKRGSGGATQVGTATIAGQAWTIYKYGSGELIWSLGAPGTFAQQGSGTVDLLAILKASIARGLMSPNAVIGQIDVGWEICSTGGVAETFRVTDYSITGVPL